jgi:hypothetical protein
MALTTLTNLKELEVEACTEITVMVEMKPVMVEMKLVMVKMKSDMVEIHFDQKATFRRLHFDMSGLWRRSRIFNPLPLMIMIDESVERQARCGPLVQFNSVHTAAVHPNCCAYGDVHVLSLPLVVHFVQTQRLAVPT